MEFPTTTQERKMINSWYQGMNADQMVANRPVIKSRPAGAPGRVVPSQPNRYQEDRVSTPTRTNSASDKQVEFIYSLLRQVDITDEQRAAAHDQLGRGLTSQKASAWIDKLVQMRDAAKPAAKPEPTGDLAIVVADLEKRNAEGSLNDFGVSLHEQYTRRGTLSEKQVAAWMKGLAKRAARQVEVAVDLPDVPKGRYAIDGTDRPLDFFRVGRKHNGQTTLHVQGGPAEYEVPFNAATYRNVLQRILDAGINEAQARYGRELGHCGRCGLELTDATSRSIGMGPDCRAHAGI
jgi:hypothetical protein